MGGDITSTVSNIEFYDNIGLLFVYSGTPTGEFFVEGSINHVQDQNGNVTTVGNWVPIDLDPSAVASGAAGEILIDLNQLSFPWLRVRYARSSGTGTLDVYISGKSLT
jgi:hypothetical protein